jgi:hypothetical protein
MSAQSVIDEIDALVDEQLRQEASGYDNNLGVVECLCGLDWHGLPEWGCPGTDAEGPVQINVPIEFATRYEMLHESFNPIAMFDRLAQHYWESVAVSFSRLAEAFNAPAPVPETFRLDRWVEDHDWQAEMRGSEPRFVMMDEAFTFTRPALPTPATQPPMWTVDPTRTRRGKR